MSGSCLSPIWLALFFQLMKVILTSNLIISCDFFQYIIKTLFLCSIKGCGRPKYFILDEDDLYGSIWIINALITELVFLVIKIEDLLRLIFCPNHSRYFPRYSYMTWALCMFALPKTMRSFANKSWEIGGLFIFSWIFSNLPWASDLVIHLGSTSMHKINK